MLAKDMAIRTEAASKWAMDRENMLKYVMTSLTINIHRSIPNLLLFWNAHLSADFCD